MITIIKHRRYEGRAPRFHNGDKLTRRSLRRPSLVWLLMGIEALKRADRRGFTLVEGIVLAAAVAVVLAISWPWLHR